MVTNYCIETLKYTSATVEKLEHQGDSHKVRLLLSDFPFVCGPPKMINRKWAGSYSLDILRFKE